MGKRRLYGTREWSAESCNFISGCRNDCRYCYAKENAIFFKRATPDTWKDMVVREKDVKRGYRKRRRGTVMFPSSHDIFPEHLEMFMEVLGKRVRVNDRVAIVSKPRLECVRTICERFGEYKDKILFRFTITSADDEVLKFWEPNAPGFEERLACLRHAYEAGYQTSLSCEPMLDDNVHAVIEKAMPYVTDAIWIGTANHFPERLERNGHDDPETMARMEELLGWQTPDRIKALYERYKDNPMIKYKNEVKKIVGIPLPPEIGMDV